MLISSFPALSLSLFMCFILTPCKSSAPFSLNLIFLEAREDKKKFILRLRRVNCPLMDKTWNKTKLQSKYNTSLCHSPYWLVICTCSLQKGIGCGRGDERHFVTKPRKWIMQVWTCWDFHSPLLLMWFHCEHWNIPCTVRYVTWWGFLNTVIFASVCSCTYWLKKGCFVCVSSCFEVGLLQFAF